MPIPVQVTQVGLEASIKAAAAAAGRNLKVNVASQEAARKTGRNLGIDLGANSKSIDSLSRPLGKITGQADEFTKSMEAANARVLAFGASVGVLAGVVNGFQSLVRTTIEVEKTMANINSVLGKSASELDQFKSEIFDVARATGSSFETVSTAALELSRQGLSSTEVISRLNDAMILSRLSGLGAAESVDGLTAAFNSFKDQGETSATILNKVAAAAAAYAVSEKDLIEGIKRSGSVAQQAGVNLNELASIITAVQERTSAGGAVIGNSFKTIFTRIGKEDTLAALKGLGIEITDVSGRILPATKLLENLAQKIDGLSQLEISEITQKVGGGFQIDKLLASLKDMSSESSVFKGTMKELESAGDKAYSRNIALNETLAASINTAGVNLKELANTLGEIGISGNLNSILSFFNSFASGIQDILDGEGIGSQLARGIVKGIGNIISGPGLAIFGAIIIKLSYDLIKFGAASLKSFFGVNQASKEMATLQGTIANALLNNKKIQSDILALEGNRVAQAAYFSTALDTQIAKMNQMRAIAADIAPVVMRDTQIYSKKAPTSADGYVPTAAEGYAPAVAQESANIKKGVGGARPSDRPVVIPNFSFGGGKTGTMVAHTGEHIVKNYGGSGGSAVFNRDMVKSMGLPDGAQKISAAGGIIPNFVKPKVVTFNEKFGVAQTTVERELRAYNEYRLSIKKSATNVRSIYDNVDNAGDDYNEFRGSSEKRNILKAKQETNVLNREDSKGKAKYAFVYNSNETNVKNLDYKTPKGNTGTYRAIGVSVEPGNYLYDLVRSGLIQNAKDYAKQLEINPDIVKDEQFGKIVGQTLNRGSVEGALGTVFESAFQASIQAPPSAQNANFDIQKGSFGKLNEIFQKIGGAAEKKAILSKALNGAFKGGEFKNALNSDNIASFYNKIDNDTAVNLASKTPALAAANKTRTSASGYIPNFALGGLEDSNPEKNTLEGRVFEALLRKEKSINLQENIVGPDITSGGPPLAVREAKLSGKSAYGDSNFGFGKPKKEKLILPQNAVNDFDDKLIRLRKADIFRSNISTNKIFGIAANIRKRESTRKTDRKNVPIYASGGFIPNFADPLKDAISREVGAGVEPSKVYVDKNDSLKNSGNPMGLMVANRRDEPAGGFQGIARARKEGANAQTYGAVNGFIPNFAKGSTTKSGKGSTTRAGNYIYDSDKLDLISKKDILEKILRTKTTIRKDGIIAPSGAGKSTLAMGMGKFIRSLDDVDNAASFTLLSGSELSKNPNGISDALQRVLNAIKLSGGTLKYLNVPDEEIERRRLKRAENGSDDLRSQKQLEGSFFIKKNQPEFIESLQKEMGDHFQYAARGFVPNFASQNAMDAMERVASYQGSDPRLLAEKKVAIGKLDKLKSASGSKILKKEEFLKIFKLDSISKDYINDNPIYKLNSELNNGYLSGALEIDNSKLKNKISAFTAAKGFVPNFALNGSLKSAYDLYKKIPSGTIPSIAKTVATTNPVNIAKTGLFAAKAAKAFGVSMPKGEKLNIESIWANLTNFVQNPEKLIKNQRDLTDAKTATQTILNNDILRDRFAKFAAQRVNTALYNNKNVIVGTEDERPSGSLMDVFTNELVSRPIGKGTLMSGSDEEYLKYRLLGGTKSLKNYDGKKPSQYFEKGGYLKLTKDSSEASEVVESSYSASRGGLMSSGNKPRMIDEKGGYYGVSSLMGGFTGRQKKIKGKDFASYKDVWDVALNSAEKKILNDYLNNKTIPSKDTVSSNNSYQPRNPSLGFDIAPYILRELVSSIPKAKPAVFKGVVTEYNDGSDDGYSKGFVPNFVSESRSLGKGVYGEFYKLGKTKIGDKFGTTKEEEANIPIGVKRFRTDTGAKRKNLNKNIATEYAMARLLSEYPLVKGITAPKIFGSFEESLRRKSIKKQIINDQLGENAIGEENADGFGYVIKAALKSKGLNMHDLHGTNYTINTRGEKVIEKNDSYIADAEEVVEYDWDSLGSSFINNFSSKGGIVNIIDAGSADTEDKGLKTKLEGYLQMPQVQKNAARGFVPNFVSKSRELGRGVQGAFYKLGEKDGTQVGVKKFFKDGPSKAVEMEWLIAEFISKYAKIPSVFGPKNLSTLEDSKRKLSIRKEVVSDPLAKTALGSQVSNAFGSSVLFNALGAKGLSIGDLHGSNYTVNKNAENAIDELKNYPQNSAGAFSTLRDMASAGAKISILDPGAAKVSGLARDTIGEIITAQPKQKNAAKGFVPNFALVDAFHGTNDKLFAKKIKETGLKGLKKAVGSVDSSNTSFIDKKDMVDVNSRGLFLTRDLSTAKKYGKHVFKTQIDDSKFYDYDKETKYGVGTNAFYSDTKKDYTKKIKGVVGGSFTDTEKAEGSNRTLPGFPNKEVTKNMVMSRGLKDLNFTQVMAGGYIPNFVDLLNSNSSTPTLTLQIARTPEQSKEKSKRTVNKKTRDKNWRNATGGVGKIFNAIHKGGPKVLIDGIVSGVEIQGMNLDYLYTLIKNSGSIAQLLLGNKGSNFVTEAQKHGVTIEEAAKKRLVSLAAKSLNKLKGVASDGFMPNFADPLKDAISREVSAGVNPSQVYVDQHSSLKNSGNPMGLMVANRRDEPAGGFQGIARARKEGANAQTYGAASGFIPNYANQGAGTMTSAVGNSTGVARSASAAPAATSAAEKSMGDMVGKLILFQTVTAGLTGAFDGLGGKVGKFGEALTGLSGAILSIVLLKSSLAPGSSPFAKGAFASTAKDGAGGMGKTMGAIAGLAGGLFKLLPYVGMAIFAFQGFSALLKLANFDLGAEFKKLGQFIGLLDSPAKEAANKLKELAKVDISNITEGNFSAQGPSALATFLQGQNAKINAEKAKILLKDEGDKPKDAATLNKELLQREFEYASFKTNKGFYAEKSDLSPKELQAQYTKGGDTRFQSLSSVEKKTGRTTEISEVFKGVTNLQAEAISTLDATIAKFASKEDQKAFVTAKESGFSPKQMGPYIEKLIASGIDNIGAGKVKEIKDRIIGSGNFTDEEVNKKLVEEIVALQKQKTQETAKLNYQEKINLEIAQLRLESSIKLKMANMDLPTAQDSALTIEKELLDVTDARKVSIEKEIEARSRSKELIKSQVESVKGLTVNSKELLDQLKTDPNNDTLVANWDKVSGIVGKYADTLMETGDITKANAAIERDINGLFGDKQEASAKLLEIIKETTSSTEKLFNVETRRLDINRKNNAITEAQNYFIGLQNAKKQEGLDIDLRAIANAEKLNSVNDRIFKARAEGIKSITSKDVGDKIDKISNNRERASAVNSTANEQKKLLVDLKKELIKTVIDKKLPNPDELSGKISRATSIGDLKPIGVEIAKAEKQAAIMKLDAAFADQKMVINSSNYFYDTVKKAAEDLAKTLGQEPINYNTLIDKAIEELTAAKRSKADPEDIEKIQTKLNELKSSATAGSGTAELQLIQNYQSQKKVLENSPISSEINNKVQDAADAFANASDDLSAKLEELSPAYSDAKKALENNFTKSLLDFENKLSKVEFSNVKLRTQKEISSARIQEKIDNPETYIGVKTQDDYLDKRQSLEMQKLKDEQSFQSKIDNNIAAIELERKLYTLENIIAIKDNSQVIRDLIAKIQQQQAGTQVGISTSATAIPPSLVFKAQSALDNPFKNIFKEINNQASNCAKVIKTFAESLNISIVGATDVANSFQEVGISIDKLKIKAGDILIDSRGKKAGEAGGHVGMYLGDGKVLQASQSAYNSANSNSQGGGKQKVAITNYDPKSWDMARRPESLISPPVMSETDSKQYASIDLTKIQQSVADVIKLNVEFNKIPEAAMKAAGNMDLQAESQQRVAGIIAETVRQSKLRNLEDEEAIKLAEELFKIKDQGSDSSFAGGYDEGIRNLNRQTEGFAFSLGERVPQMFSDNMANAMEEIILKGGDVGDVLMDAATSFLNEINKATFKNIADKIVSGQGGSILKAASGGKITGGSGNKDDVPAMLMGGEFVMNKKAVSKYGDSFMEKINKGSISHFAKGGKVEDTEFISERGLGTQAASNQYPSTQTGKGGFFTPGLMGSGSITGKKDLLNFATQSYTSGENDIIKSGKNSASIDLETESVRLTNFGRKNGPQAQALREAKSQSFDVYKQQLDQEKQIKEAQEAYDKERKAKIKGLLTQIGVSAAMFGASTAANGINAAKIEAKSLNLTGMDANKFALAGALKGGNIDGTNVGGLGNLFKGNFALSQISSRSQLSDYYDSKIPKATVFDGDKKGLVPKDYIAPSNNLKRATGGQVPRTAGIDTVSTMLSGGEFVMNASASSRIGPEKLNQMNSGATQTSNVDSEVLNEKLISKLDELIEASKNKAGSVTVNVSSDGSSQTSSSKDQTEQDKNLSEKIKNSVLQVIAQEKRMGGMLAR